MRKQAYWLTTDTGRVRVRVRYADGAQAYAALRLIVHAHPSLYVGEKAQRLTVTAAGR